MSAAARISLREAYAAGAQRLVNDPYLSEQATRDAANLLLHALALPDTALYAYPERSVSDVEAAAFEDLLGRRLRHEPMQYILGETEFCGLSLRVTRATLIPRSETEVLVEATLARLPKSTSLHLLDVGTGTGAIAIALAQHLPHADVLALDVSEEALAVARDNALRNHVADRVDLRVSDLLASVSPGDHFDVIVSNPPYIPERDRSSLHPQVRDHEPSLALFAGVDGLDVYRRLIPQAHVALKLGGLLGLEIGYGQSEAVTHLLKDWSSVEVLEDSNAIPRVVLARRA